MCKKLILLLWTALLTAVVLQAQTVKNVSVSNESSFTDHISLSEDSRDMDIMVKLVFDEQKNSLTVSVLSYRSLFVFREASRYHSVVRGSSLRPDLLPYVAEAEPKAKFVLSKALKKSIHKKKKYVFNRWVEYDGLQPAPAAYKMVNDYIEQAFEIQGQRGVVTLTLRDIFLLEPSKKNPKLYTLMQGRDLNLRYQIQILRNPCFGLDDELAATAKVCTDAKTAWDGFKKNYGSGEVASADELNTFNQTKDVLLTQFPRRKDRTACPDLLQYISQYNNYVDSIANLTCQVSAPEEQAWDDGKPLDTKLIYSQARQIDKSVARYLVSKDPLERSDLLEQCGDIVSDVSGMIQRYKAPLTPEEAEAVRVYRQAEQYFRKTCNQ